MPLLKMAGTERIAEEGSVFIQSVLRRGEKNVGVRRGFP